MVDKFEEGHREPMTVSHDRPVRADARRNIEALLKAARDAFNSSGVDVPMRKIAEAAGVDVGTIYRHYPTRADLVVAVFRREVDACAEKARTIAQTYKPEEAL
ncbi:helix-turn-helix domain-containing protein [Breoghania sp.]|uniref:TetR/AcrR family transcriptional regulator n=1 Tax=Breoghania sp. TaxID=2065378 RepID=UPI003204BDA4